MSSLKLLWKNEAPEVMFVFIIMASLSLAFASNKALRLYCQLKAESGDT
jgi:hypothetical protein